MECQWKAVGDEMSFTAYGNVKNVEDLAGDIALDGCYAKSIEMHKERGTTPKLLWGHDYYLPPVGKIRHMEEDSKGFLIDGKLSKTERGKELHILGKDEAIDSFSMGYNVLDEKMDRETGINYLKSVHIREVSFVNFACNEDSLLQSMKSQILDGKMPTVREFENILRNVGFSRKQAMFMAASYKPKKQSVELAALKDYALFK